MGRWFDVHAFRVGEPAARQVAILFSDVSERRRREHEARDSDERLQYALSADQGIGTWDWDVPADPVRANIRFARLYGVDPFLAAQGAPIAAFFAGIHPGDLAARRKRSLPPLRPERRSPANIDWCSRTVRCVGSRRRAVSHTGTGMTPEVISKALDPFFTAKPLGVGTGLGLSMIYGFARQSGGHVCVYSDPVMDR